MDVGTTELRSNLAGILDEVDRGTTVNIMHRGRIRAVLSPAPSRVETKLEQGIREGWVSVGPGFYAARPHRRYPRATATLPPGMTVERIMAEDRGADR